MGLFMNKMGLARGRLVHRESYAKESRVFEMRIALIFTFGRI